MPDKNSKKPFLKRIIVVLILVTIIGGGYFIIRSNRVKEEIKNLIISQLEGRMDKGVYIGKVKNYSLKSITLSDFKLFKDKSLQDKDILFEAKEIVVNYDLDILSALEKKTAVNIKDITLIKPQMSLVRNNRGVFDFMENFNFSSDKLSFLIKKVNFKDGSLIYKDYQVTKEDGLLTLLKSLNGYFYLTNLPKVEFSFSALREEYNTPLALKGYFYLDSSDYSLDFTFKDADITHFQYYFTQAKPFNLKKGLFDLNLHLANDSNTTQGKTVWYGKTSVKDVDLYPDILGGVEIKQAKGSATFNSQETIIDNITALYKNSPFNLKGNLTYSDKFNYNIKVKSDSFKLGDLKEEVRKYLSQSNDFPLEGNSNLEFEVKGIEDNYQVEGELSTKEGKIAGYDFLNLFTKFDYSPENIHLKDLKTEIAGGLIKGIGEVNLNKELPEYSFSFDISQLNTKSDFLKPLTFNYFKNGFLSGKVDLKGIIAKGEKLNLLAKLKVKDDELGDFSFRTEGIIGKGNFVDLKMKAEGINLEKLGESLNYKEIGGNANFIGILSGFPNKLKIKGQIETEEGEIAGLSFDNLEGKIDYQDNRLRLEEIVLNNEGINLKGKGEINFLKAENKVKVNLVLDVQKADLNYLAKFYNFDIPVSGLSQGKISVQGNWPEITAQGDLELKDFNLANYKAESGNTVIIFKDKKIKIESLVLNSGKSKLYTQGEINLEEDLPLNLRVNFLNQDISNLLSNYVGSDLINKFRGQATGSLEIKGNFESPDLYLSAVIEDAQLEGLPLNSINLKLEKTGSVVKINRLELKQKKGGLIAGGWIDFNENNKKLDIDIAADKVNLGQLSNFFSIKDEEVKGLVNFKAKIEGGISSPTISFSAQIEKAKYLDFYFDNLDIEAFYKQDILEVKEFILNKGGHQIKGKGKIPYKFSFGNENKIAPSLANLPLDFTLSLENTDLNFIKIFFPEDLKQVQGLTNADLKLSGTLNHPVLNGNVGLADGEIELSKYPVKLNNLNIMLRLEDNLVKIKDMNFQIDQYKFYTSGEFAFKNLQFQDLNINIWNNEQEISYQDILNTKANFKAKLTGSFTYPHIKGTLTLSQGELNWGENKETSFDPSELLAELNKIKGNIDLEVKISDDFIARADNFNLKLGGDVKIQGALSAPKLNGELEIGQGYIAFLDKKFRITKGKVILSDSSGKDMILDIKAKSKIDDIDVLLTLGGNISHPVVTLESSPPLTENEIISLLMFNKNYAGLTEGELGTVLKEEMINLIAQGLSVRFLNQIENKVADSLGLNEFKIETIFKKDQDSNLAFIPGFGLESLALKVGKYFSENFYLTYSTPLDEIGKGNLELEYKINDDLTLSGQMDAFSPQDKDFEFKIEFQYGF